MKLLIATDIHLGSKHSTHTWKEFENLVFNVPQMILLGDIIDMANCHKKEVVLWKSRLTWLRNITKCNGGIFIRGNHEINQIDTHDFAFVDCIYFTHGDLEFWGYKKANAYRSKKAGAGFLKRWFTPVYDKLRHLKDAGPNENFYKAMDSLIAQYPKMKAIVVGHRHPTENIISEYKGVKIYILKRGIQELYI